MNYIEESRDAKLNIKNLKFKIGIILLVSVAVTVAFVTAMILNEDMRSAWFTTSAYYAVILMVFTHSLSSFMGDIKYNRQRLLRIKDKQEADAEILDKSVKFGEVYDNIIEEIQDRKTFASHYRHKFSCMIPSNDVKKWEPHPDFNNRILGYGEDGKQYVITCPATLRDKLIELQNNLGVILG